MTIRDFRQGGMARLVAVVTAALFAAGVPAAWAGPAASVRPAAALDVQSDPAGADVYVDGQLKGATPMAVEGIASGDHTVRVVKEGFLENSRTIAVPATGRSLRVTLTPTRIPARASMAQVEPGESEGGGGGGKKWLWIGLGAAVLTAGGVGLYLATKNDPPVVSGVTGSPAVALQSVTSVTFSATASDPNGDSLTYSWNFGDGGTSTVASPSHVYNTAGTFTATVEVSDGKKSVTGTTTVTVKGLSGRWTGSITVAGYSPISIVMNIAQTGVSLAGSYQADYGSGPLHGTASAPASVVITTAVPSYYPLTFTGTMGATLDSISGTARDVQSYPFTLTRQ